MKYAEKLEYAKKYADELINDKPLDQIKSELKAEGLYESDITKVMISVRNLIGDKFRPVIRQKLIDKEPVMDAVEFSKIDQSTLESVVKVERKSLALAEKKKVRDLLKENTPPEEILKSVRLDFYPAEKVVAQIETHKEIEIQNSGGYRMLMIFGGLALMAVGVVITYATMQNGGRGRLFIGLIIVGLITMIKGFFTVEDPHDYT